MDIEDLDWVNKHNKLPSRALYLAGVVKIESGLSISVILEFFDIVYSDSIPLDCLKEIEEQLYLGKIGTAKRILKLVIKRCAICNEVLEKGQKLGCGHFFHKGCLKENLTCQVLESNKVLCPYCQKDVEDFSSLDEDLAMIIEDFYLARSLSESSFQFCPGCKNMFEIEGQGTVSCPCCMIKFCSLCSEKEDACLCENFCQKCNKNYVGKQCYQCSFD